MPLCNKEQRPNRAATKLVLLGWVRALGPLIEFCTDVPMFWRLRNRQSHSANPSLHKVPKAINQWNLP